MQLSPPGAPGVLQLTYRLLLWNTPSVPIPMLSLRLVALAVACAADPVGEPQAPCTRAFGIQTEVS